MARQRKQATIDETRRATEYLANERTFLAWLRTGIAIISLGFVVAKFSLWLHELALGLGPRVQTYQSGASMPIGLAMMALGGLVTVLAAWRYHIVNRAIDRGIVSADRGLIILVTVMVTVLCVAMMGYLLVTAQHA